MTKNNPIFCDYLFAGAGASATLLLMRMEKSDLLRGKKIVVLDTDFTSLSRKTFCFWAEPDDDIVKDCQNLIQKRWDRLRIDRGNINALKPLQYHYIPGVKMQHEMASLIDRNQCQIVQSAALSLKSDDSGVWVYTSEGVFCAKRVFDSRPAGFMAPKPNESALFQSFIGYVIEPEHPIVNTDSMDMMDFGVAQQGATQFMYVLPFSQSRALVELTRFGTDVLKAEDAKSTLDNYIMQHFGSARVIETETGCIPMCSSPLKVEETDGVIRLGGRAGAVKPGTGYAFKNMYRHASEVSAQLLSGHKYIPKAPSSRFRFYDRLLLWILGNKPEWGKPIFQQLFQKNSTPRILHFLDERTSLIKDVKILLSLPFSPFLQALRQDFRYNAPKSAKPIGLSIMALTLLLLYTQLPQFYIPLQWLLLALGLFAVGIPHGAVDHLLETGNVSGRAAPGFIVKYLGIMVLYFMLWKIFPTAALAVFLLYSAFHFGQSDMQEWGINRFQNVKSLCWGLTVLFIILTSHAEEVGQILSGMSVNFPIMPNMAFGFAAALSAVIWSLHEKRQAILWSTVMLVIGMYLPLLTAFGLYFIGQHSLNGWAHLRKGMRAGNKLLFVKALPFTLGALVLMVSMFILSFADLLPWKSEQWVSVFFIFLACLSLPHVWAMHRFYNRSGQ